MEGCMCVGVVMVVVVCHRAWQAVGGHAAVGRKNPRGEPLRIGAFLALQDLLLCRHTLEHDVHVHHTEPRGAGWGHWNGVPTQAGELGGLQPGAGPHVEAVPEAAVARENLPAHNNTHRCTQTMHTHTCAPRMLECENAKGIHG